MMDNYIRFRCETEFKERLEKHAKRDSRNVSNYIIKVMTEMMDKEDMENSQK